jgi:hypothetical protein
MAAATRPHSWSLEIAQDWLSSFVLLVVFAFLLCIFHLIPASTLKGKERQNVQPFGDARSLYQLTFISV